MICIVSQMSHFIIRKHIALTKSMIIKEEDKSIPQHGRCIYRRHKNTTNVRLTLAVVTVCAMSTLTLPSL
jgi:hypothetical protein